MTASPFICLNASSAEQKLNAIEREIAGERAASLGIVGRRLESALQDYQRQCRGPIAAHRLEESRAKICDTLQELLIQREAIGLSYGNVEWVLRNYEIPREIIAKLGLR